jgi:hypothetical protein
MERCWGAPLIHGKAGEHSNPPTAAQPPAAATPPGDPGSDDSRFSDPLKAERRKINQLEKEIRTLRQQHPWGIDAQPVFHELHLERLCPRYRQHRIRE